MVFKVVINNIVDIIHFDQNTVGQILKNCVRSKKNHQICEFGQLWRLPWGEQSKIGSLSWKYKLFKI